MMVGGRPTLIFSAAMKRTDQCYRDALIYHLSARRVHHVFGKHGFHTDETLLGPNVKYVA